MGPEPTTEQTADQTLGEFSLAFERLRSLAQTELTTVETFEAALPGVDTPEMADRLRTLAHDHQKFAAGLVDLLQSYGEAPPQREPEPLLDPVGSSPVGDTLDTFRAVEDITVAEKIARSQLDSLLSSKIDLPERAHEILREMRAAEASHEEFLIRALVSLRAAVQLWGPVDAPPILHH